MKIKVNGDIIETTSTTVSSLLEELGIKAERVAVEVNTIIVKKSEYSRFNLNEGDTVEIVNFVGGGQNDGR
jgi:thiamine biosynthesis protein ThiS